MAIDWIAENGTIVVLPGTYVENLLFPGRDFILTSTDPEDPGVVAATIIDGNQNGSVVTFAGSETSDCILRGFTITNGYAEGSYHDRMGGGIDGAGAHASVFDCVITGNTSNQAGGLYDCDGTISHCTITDNDAAYGGGGLYDCDGTISHCTITGNTAANGGGLSDCDGSITNCTITDNIAYSYYSLSYGGGLYNCDGSITNCIVWANSSTHSSGDQLYIGSTPTYSCIQDWTGGGTGNITSDPLIVDSYNGDYHLKSKYGRWDADGSEEYSYLDPNSTPSDPNDDFWGTVPAVPGGWVYDAVTSPCIDTGGPISMEWQNELWPHGGRINMGAYGGTPQASMSGYPIGNMADLDHDDVVGVTDLDLFSNTWLVNKYLLDTDLDLDGRVDIADFALFAGEWLWEQGAILTVSETTLSPAAYEGGANPDPNSLTISNIGVKALNWSIDTASKPDWLAIMPTDGSVDPNESEAVTLSVDSTGLSVGPYSYTFEVSDPAADNSPQSVTVQLHVRDNYLVVPDDTSTIQTAIDNIAENGTIVVQPGTYVENLLFPGRDFILTSTDPEDPGVVAATIIDGNQNGSVVTFAGSETSDCLLTGFTMTNGKANGTRGGGLLGNDMQASISHCTITGNTAANGGGLSDCDGHITNCTITGNTAGDNGGGLSSCDGSITNCTITGNTAANGGGLSFCDGHITNCTITGNTAGDNGGGLYYCRGAITNCIIWGNSAVDWGDQLDNGSTPTYSCIRDWTGGGTGNLTGNPLFVDMSSSDPADWDFHLLSGSPCIDAGTNTPPGGLPDTDKDGNPRIIDGDANGSDIVDMGAYEYVP